MQELRANTQVIVTVGPFVDVGDGFTPQTDIALSGNEAELIKHGSTSVVSISGATWAAVTDCRGYYSLTLTTSHTNTEGLLVVVVQDDSDCLPVKAEYMVLAEAAWDSKYVAKDTGFMDVNVKAVSEDTGAADNLEAACDNYSVTRGLTGTALPAVVADAAGGLPTTTKLTDARLAILTDWIDGGRLDLLLDATALATKLEAYVQLLARNDAAIATDRATELGEINADEGSGAGSYASTTDAQEALRDNLAETAAVAEVAATAATAATAAVADTAPTAAVAEIAATAAVADTAPTAATADTAPTADTAATAPTAAVAEVAAVAAVAAAADVVTALKESTGWSDEGVVTFQTMVRVVYGSARGKITVASGVYSVWGDDGTTLLFTFTPSTGATTRATT